MFFTGKLNTTISVPAVINDIINILTGVTTTVAGLSPNFNPATCKMVNTVPAGWTKTDIAAGPLTNGVTACIIKSPMSDDPTKFKNIEISAEYNASFISFGFWEAWNDTTHVGLNCSNASSTGVPQYINTSAYISPSYVVTVSVSPNHVFVHIHNDALSAYSNVLIFASEFTRDDPWNTVANGYPSWFSTSSGANSPQSSFRIPNVSVNPIIDTIDSTLTSGTIATAYGDTLWTGTNPHAAGPTIAQDSLTATMQRAYVLAPISYKRYKNTTTGNHIGGNIDAKSPFVYVFKEVWVPGDEMVVNGITYLYVKLSPGALAIKEA